MGDLKRYPGGKNLAGFWQWIIDRMPTHSLYVEPFAGSGAILRRKPPALRSVCLDLDVAATDWLCSLALPGVETLRGDGIAWLSEHAGELDALGDDALVYCDPPYHPQARVKQRIYKYELSRRDHLQLLDVVCALRCRVMISGYRTSQYAMRLAGWHQETRAVITRGGTMRDEHLWCNFDPGDAAAPFVRPNPGSGFRERERIKRKIRRWDEDYRGLPPRERRCLLAVLIESERQLSRSPGEAAAPGSGIAIANDGHHRRR